MVYTYLLNPSVVVRVESDDPINSGCDVQKEIAEYLLKFKTPTMVAVESNCNRVWPHGRDESPLVRT